MHLLRCVIKMSDKGVNEKIDAGVKEHIVMVRETITKKIPCQCKYCRSKKQPATFILTELISEKLRGE